MAGKKIKLDKEAISEILVADTDSELGSEASDFEDYFEEEEEEEEEEEDDDNNNNNNNYYYYYYCSKRQQMTNHRLQQVSEDYHPGNCLKEGTQIFILLLVQQKVRKRVRLHTSTKTAHHCLCSCCFSQKFFICWLNRPTYITSNS